MTLKGLKIPTNVIDSHIANVLSHDLLIKRFPEKPKISNVRPIYKKKAKEELKNCTHVLILSALSKTYESFIRQIIGPYVGNVFYPYLYQLIGKKCGSNPVLLIPIEKW